MGRVSEICSEKDLLLSLDLTTDNTRYQTITTVYASEVLPVSLRGYLTSYVNLCWVIGQFIGSGILVAFENRVDIWGWRIPFGIQWAWPIPILVVCFFAPESPTWLVRKNKLAAAELSLKRLQSPTANDIPTPSETVAALVETDAIEKELVAGTTYTECFRGTNLRRTEIATITWVMQQMCGPVLQTYATYFYLQAGLASSQAFNLTLGMVSDYWFRYLSALTITVCACLCWHYSFVASDQELWKTNHFPKWPHRYICVSHDYRIHWHRTSDQHFGIVGNWQFLAHLHLHVSMIALTRQ